MGSSSNFWREAKASGFGILYGMQGLYTRMIKVLYAFWSYGIIFPSLPFPQKEVFP
jgi:hypothetical protein